MDLSGELGRSLEHERAVHAVLGMQRDLALGLSARVEAYWKDLDDLVIGRLETEAERLARVGHYAVPVELASSIPASPIITSYPENGASGQSWRFSPKWEIAATARAFSGFPRTPVLGLRVAAQQMVDGSLVPARDAEGSYVYETYSGDVANLNSARLPAFFRLELRLSWKPRRDPVPVVGRRALPF